MKRTDASRLTDGHHITSKIRFAAIAIGMVHPVVSLMPGEITLPTDQPTDKKHEKEKTQKGSTRRLDCCGPQVYVLYAC